MRTPDFIPGLDLAEAYYWQAVRPILEARFPGLVHSAALIGYGSDVQGFDTLQSTDHLWGPRLQLFLAEEGFNQIRQEVDEALRQQLPLTFMGWPTSFGDEDEAGVRLLSYRETGPVNHLIEIVTIKGYFKQYLGIDPQAQLNPPDWLVLQEHRLRAVTGGRVFADGAGRLKQVRDKLAFYPHDVWLYIMAAEWMKLDQEAPFVGRTGDVGDDLGSRLITARLIHTLMRLAFLQERQYPPYSKWFGTAFARLSCAPALTPAITSALQAETWRGRETALNEVSVWLAERHNQMGITPAQESTIRNFHDRPYRVLGAARFVNALLMAVQDPAVKALPRYVGSVNQFVVSVDVLDEPERCGKLKSLYGTEEDK